MAEISAELRDVVDRYINVWNTGRVEELDELTTPDFDLRVVNEYLPRTNREALKRFILNRGVHYPDFRIDYQYRPSTDERILIATWVIDVSRASQAGPSPTGKRVLVTGFSMLFLSGGKVSGEWINFTDLDWVNKLGYHLLPTDQGDP